jgi:lysozyme family protein
MNFRQIFDRRLMPHEGGYVNDPNDPGGETNWGISKRSYPHLDIRALTREEAFAIYKSDFWDRIHGDKLHDGVGYQLFDFAVNSGIETAVRYFQRALGVADDGHWGKISQKAADTMSETDQIMRLNAERLDFMTRLSVWPSFSRGWSRRIAGNLRYGAEDS